MRILPALSTVLATLMLAAVGVPASAQQAQQPQRPQFVTQFDDTTIRYLLADIQATYQVEQASDGSNVYRATAEGQINFTLAQRACATETGCPGLMLIALFTNLQVSDATRLDAFIHQFNDQNPTAKLIRGPRNVVALQAYINASYGITYRNAQSQLLVFGENIVTTSRALANFERGG